jgi:hypothetical protein
VRVLGVQDRSKATNTESAITLACTPTQPGAKALEEMRDHCEDMLRRRNLDDEVRKRARTDTERNVVRATTARSRETKRERTASCARRSLFGRAARGVVVRGGRGPSERAVFVACAPPKSRRSPLFSSLSLSLSLCLPLPPPLLPPLFNNPQIQDRTTPDLEIEKISCEYTNSAKVMAGPSAKGPNATAAGAMPAAAVASSAAAPALTAALAFVAAAAAVAL